MPYPLTCLYRPNRAASEPASGELIRRSGAPTSRCWRCAGHGPVQEAQQLPAENEENEGQGHEPRDRFHAPAAQKLDARGGQDDKYRHIGSDPRDGRCFALHPADEGDVMARSPPRPIKR